MGTYEKGMFGAFNGKVGSLVGSNYRGLNVLRTRPKKSSKPASEDQQMQRQKFGIIVQFLSKLKMIIRDYYGREQGYKSRLNRCISDHAKTAIAGVFPDYEIDYSKVIFTKGDLDNVYNTSVSQTIPGQLEFNWQSNAGIGLNELTDTAILIAYNASKQRFYWIISNQERSMETASLQVPIEHVGDEVHTWITFRSIDKKLVSTSSYLGSLTLS